MEERATAHFEILRQDARDEIKKRIEQRDRYSIQLTISLAALFAFSFSPVGFPTALIAAPFLSIYFTVLIMYSFRVHRVLAKYLREEIEPEIARLYKISVEKEWENYYQSQAVPGIRKQFFLGIMWVVSISSLLYLWLAELKQLGLILLIVTTAVYGASIIVITLRFWRK